MDDRRGSAANLLPFWVTSSETLAVAVIGPDGRVLEASRGWQGLLGPADGQVTVPELGLFFQVQPGQLVYDGPLQVQAGEGAPKDVPARLFRDARFLVALAEDDAGAVERKDHELDELHRQLMRRNEMLAKAMREIEDLKRHDTVTGLPNRKQLDDRADEEIRRWERYRRPLGLLLLNIDDFHRVNQQYGHPIGDEVLQHVATILKQSVRDLDFVVRYGGDEFGLLLPETNEMGALIVAERLRMELENRIILPLLEPLTASFGVAALQPDETREGLYNRAARAVRHSIQHGRNCVTMAGVVEECDMIYHPPGRVQEGNTTNVPEH